MCPDRTVFRSAADDGACEPVVETVALSSRARPQLDTDQGVENCGRSQGQWVAGLEAPVDGADRHDVTKLPGKRDLDQVAEERDPEGGPVPVAGANGHMFGAFSPGVSTPVRLGPRRDQCGEERRNTTDANDRHARLSDPRG